MRFDARASAVGVWLACSQAAVVAAQTRPMIERIVPTAGPPGTRVRIEGRGFSRGLRVLYNEQPVTPLEVLPERITVTVPDDARSGRFVLAMGADETESPETFRVTDRLPAPVVRSVDPSTAVSGASPSRSSASGWTPASVWRPRSAWTAAGLPKRR